MPHAPTEVGAHSHLMGAGERPETSRQAEKKMAGRHGLVCRGLARYHARPEKTQINQPANKKIVVTVVEIQPGDRRTDRQTRQTSKSQ